MNELLNEFFGFELSTYWVSFIGSIILVLMFLMLFKIIMLVISTFTR